MKDNLQQILASDSTSAARQLLGWTICRQTEQRLIKLRLVETEAYHQDDPASHSFRGRTARTAPMFESGGHIYVYFTYGMHYALNIVTGPAGRGEGVLIRAAEPLEGIEIMKANRGQDNVNNLANGPGKLAQALGIRDTRLSGKKLGNKTIWLEAPLNPVRDEDVVIGPRIGISRAVEVQARFYIKDCQYVSKVKSGD